jgi:amino acid adenylation domain-containing protein
MLRGLLLRLDEEEYAFLLSSHHICSDGWSKMVLFKELTALYEAHCNARPALLPELPIQYADYAVWQRESLRGPVVDRPIAYWKEKLAGAPALLELPLDKPRPALQTFRGSFFRTFFPRQLLDAVRAVGQQADATLFMTLLAAFDLVLSRYSGQEDIVVGTPIAGRNRPEIESLIGYFTNTLALRTRVSRSMTFQQLLRQVRETCLEAYDHQELPFEKLVVELRPERDLSHSPVFQVLFSLGYAESGVLELPGLKVNLITLDRGITKFDLTIGLTELPDALAIGCEYSTDLFDPETPARLIESFRVVLEGIVANPDSRLADLPVLSPTDRDYILNAWNDTRADFPPEAVVHRLVDAQARRTPDAPAVEWEGLQFTYRELNDRANRLARYLRKRGVGPEDFVGICVERSLEMAVGLLGILKAGGAYLPLDPAYPPDRLAFLMKDGRSPVLLTQKGLRGQLPASHAEVICLDSDWPAIAQESATDPGVPVSPDRAAYLIYTSGSTGQPRGVVITHRSLVNHNLAAIREYGISPADRVLQFASLSFDIAVEEIFPTWIAGATLVLRPRGLLPAGPAFTSWLRANRLTVLDLPTAFWHEWVQDLAVLDEPLPESLRLVIVGGEEAQPAAFATWYRAVGDRVRWINTYGPTESTVVATVYEPKQPSNGEVVDLPIGRPLANARAYVLDSSQQPVPVGVAGELYVGGVAVARGYWNRPLLTAEKFVPDPFSGEPGARMYRTGDRVRHRRDGNIEFLGRVDNQVKIRGFRVEPGEVEAQLCLHPGVCEAAVVDRADGPDRKRLVAYVGIGGKELITVRSLRDHLRQRLPDYMVPSAFVCLPLLPKTPNGKLDRRALPAPDADADRSGQSSVPPLDPEELQLAMLWEDVLGVRPVGRHDNFFELGGHSLSAVRMLARVAQLFGRRLPLASLFQAPTVSQLVELLRREEDYTWETPIPIQPRGSRPPLFCVAAPHVNALGFVFLARHLGPDQPTYGLQSHYGAKRRLVYTREEYEDLASSYVVAMRKVQPRGPYFLAGTCEGSHIAFEMACQLTKTGEEVALLAMLDAWPLENTTSYFRHAYVHYYANRIRSLLAYRQVNLLALAKAKAKSILHRLSGKARWRRVPGQVPADSSHPSLSPSVDDWRARLWPGKGFVPPTFPGRITVFRVRRQPYWRIWDKRLGWGPWARDGVDLYTVPGRHTSFLREPNVQEVAELLGRCLQQAVSRVSEGARTPAKVLGEGS